MSERKRVNKENASKLMKGRVRGNREDEQKQNPDELRTCLYVIGDLATKIFSPNKYPNIPPEEEEVLQDLSFQYEDYERCVLWRAEFDPIHETYLGTHEHDYMFLYDETLEHLKDRIAESYSRWVNWIKYSSYENLYIALVESLHPATKNTLAKFVTEFQSPDQIRALQDLETAFKEGLSSRFTNMNFEEFKENEFQEYQKLVRDRIAHHRCLADLLEKEKEKIDHWPPQWMLNTVGIMNNLNSKKQFIPIVKFLRDHAFHRTEFEAKKFDKYIKDGKEYDYLVTKVNTGRIADSLDISKDTVKLYIGAMKKAGFIRPLTNPYYALGYWNNKHWNRIYFLTNTPENRKKLLSFSLK